jgi:hypothetical protein
MYSSEPQTPVVDGCYVDEHGDMYKVRLVTFRGQQPSRIVLENVRGNLFSLSLTDWYQCRLIPCCLASSTAQPMLREA